MQGLICANGATTGGASWFGTYRFRELLAGASNYNNWIMNGDLRTYAYKTKGEMLADGKLKKGDIILMLPTTGSPANRDTHLAFFWGNTPSEDKMWHSSSTPSVDENGHKGNMITKITPVSAPSCYIVIKLDNETEQQPVSTPTPVPTPSTAPMPTEEKTLRKEDGVWKCYAGETFLDTYTGAVRYNGGIFYVTNGILDWSYTGLTKFENRWLYFTKSKVDYSYTGATRYNGGIFYVTNGTLNWSYTGLTKFENRWLYFTKSKVDYSYTGSARYNGGLFYVTKGTLNWSYTGLTKFEGRWLYFTRSKFDSSFSGLVNYNGGLFYVSKGVINWSYTGMAKYNNTWYYIVNSKRSYYNGTIKQNGVTYTIKNGIATSWK